MKEENEEYVTPTLKGETRAIKALWQLVLEGKIHEDDYLILDIYTRMATSKSIEELLGPKIVIVKESPVIKIIRI